MRADAGTTAWVLASAALVLFMTPGLAFFYGGMVRSKNVLGMLMQNFACIAVVSLVWALVGYSVAFGPDVDGVTGSLRFAGLAGAETRVPGLHLAVPAYAFVAFEMMFAVLTCALLTGAGADRMRFSGFVVFIAAWSLFVYAPIAHWVFSPHGWLVRRGVLDFAGGTVVETSSGAAALALVCVLGRRRGWPREAMAPHSLPYTMIGAGILWFGWFGFNAGSALAANGQAAHALLTTHLAGCGGLVGWALVERWRAGHATTLGAASGAVAGLVAITPGAGYLPVWAAVGVGIAAGAVGVAAVNAKFRLGYDDALDVVGVHGVCGVLGTLAVGLFATHVGPGRGGLLAGDGAGLLGEQALAVVVTAAWSFGVTWLIAKAVSATVGLRLSEQDEYDGLDTSQHAETAYDLSAVRTAGRIGV